MRHITIDNFLGQTFHHGSFSDSWLSYENRIVFGAAVEDFNDTDDFFITANNRINLALASQFSHIDTIFFQQTFWFLRSWLRLASLAGIGTVAATASIGSARLGRRSSWFLRLLKIAEAIEEVIDRICSVIVGISNSTEQGMFGVCFHDLVAVLAQIHLLFMAIYIGIKVNRRFIDFTILTKHADTSFLLVCKLFIEIIKGQK